jgi:hypothetical protein
MGGLLRTIVGGHPDSADRRHAIAATLRWAGQRAGNSPQGSGPAGMAGAIAETIRVTPALLSRPALPRLEFCGGCHP